MSRNGMLGFAFSKNGPLRFAPGAGVVVGDLFDPSRDLGALKRVSQLTCWHIGALGAGHDAGADGGERPACFLLVEHLAEFRGGGDAVVAHGFVLSAGGARQSEGSDGRSSQKEV